MRLHRLDLNLLIVLDAILENGSVSRTAEQLFLSQPAVSNALGRLRQHFGDELFVMVGRRLVPTPMASHLREPVRQFLALSREIAATRPHFDPATAERRFTFVCSDYIASLVLTRLVRELARRAPGMEVHHFSITSEALAKCAAGEFDFLIAPDHIGAANPRFQRLFTEEFVIIACAGNTALPPRITLEDFLQQRLVNARFGNFSRLSTAEEFLAQHGYRAQNRVLCSGFTLAAEMVIGTPYLALVHRRHALDRIRHLPLRIIEPDFRIPPIHENLYWRAPLDKEPSAVWLRDLIEEVAAELRAVPLLA
ncbi:LysR family transcriptional regulator [Roseomonas sp. GC11]|uniref:LysR family transcriptional regulator n=1 Tax=Roseomonas sp. GC11 TaxID=2950546 RepID=UPI0021093834|nr:LysR family transcriptional regulator [Roseomonas sp. GC11]MCQ4159480.1 LysR family transcriptional regulator [Roseomonas sp. GC11]